ncbi:MAG: diacylglycerol kinase family protein [Bacteroidetes bacterium]|nr:diacylglycerol kinase family protein [Bacteroidota bacterium]
MKENKSFSIGDRLLSFGFAFQGLITFFKTQHNAWIHLLSAIVVIVLGFIYHVTAVEWCWLIVAIGFVFAAEMFNTAIEFLTDLVSPQFHPLAKKVKDVAAGAVLVAAIMAVAIGLIVFLPKLF